MKPRQFLGYWLVMLFTLALAVEAFNVIVDPYRVFGMPLFVGFNANKTAAMNYQWLWKAYAVNQERPKTILLGSSRVAVGLDARGSGWPAERLPVYNLGLGGGTPYAQFRYLQHWMFKRTPETVIVGLDFEYFLENLESQHPEYEFFESRLTVHSDGTPNTSEWHQYLLDFAQFSLSLDSLLDSFETVIGNLRGDSSDIIGGNEPDEERLQMRLRTGTFPFVEWNDVAYVRRFQGRLSQFAMDDLRSILDLCESRGTHAILYIHPMPADTLEIMAMRGFWPIFEEWKRELVRLVSEYPGGRKAPRVVLWDFSDYDEYSTETIQQDHRILHWFWDSSHYTRALGDLIVTRMVGTSDAHVGTQLTAEDLSAHLAEIRERRSQYRATHKTDMERVRAVYEAETRLLRSPAMAARTPALVQW